MWFVSNYRLFCIKYKETVVKNLEDATLAKKEKKLSF